MGEAGLFANERVELLDGTIVTMSAQSSPHAGTVDRLLRQLLAACPGASVRCQLPVVLDDWSEPEPDVAVCVRDPHDYTRQHPDASQVRLVCEIAASSLDFDRRVKAGAYAAAGIAACWVVDVEGRIVHVLDQPDRASRRYGRERQVGDDGHVEAPGGVRVAVMSILPPL